MIQKNAFKQAIAPYLALALVIVVGVIGFVLFSTLLIVSAVIGFVIYVIASIRLAFIKRQMNKAAEFQPETRVIDVQFTKMDDD